MGEIKKYLETFGKDIKEQQAVLAPISRGIDRVMAGGYFPISIASSNQVG